MSAVSKTIGPLHFEDLEPRRFEDLIRQLAYDFRSWRTLEATGRAGSDNGFDARGYEIVNPSADVLPDEADIDADDIPPEGSHDRLWLIQCKRERTIAPTKLRKHLSGINTEHSEPLYGIIFAAACDFSKHSRDVFREWCRDHDISEAHIWGKAEVEDQLFQPKNDHLLFAYFGISLQIRHRSIRTALRARLAMKHKCECVLAKLPSYVLLRDPTDDRYP
jgi:hypothetical protein